MKVFSYNPHLTGQAQMIPDIIYSTATGETLKAAILTPLDPELKKKPAILFVQGSGWSTPNIYSKIPQLSLFAQAGYLVMTIVHRDRNYGHPFPAFLQDVKCAVRYLRANAEKYGIDEEKIAIFGTSSGGNASLLTAMTGDDPRYKTSEYGEFSDQVQCAVDCFGPTFMEKMSSGGIAIQFAKQLSGERDMMEVVREMSPCCILDEKKDYPPMLLLYGTADPIVPHQQGEEFHQMMQAAGKDTELVLVENAVHEGNFWSREVYEYILAWLDRKLK